MSVRPERGRRIGLVILLIGVVGIGAAIYVDARREQGDLEARVSAMTGGDIAHGRDLFQSYGCGACHTIGSVPQARGKIGPPLEGFSSRALIAGKLPNDPASLQSWIVDPQAVTPGTAMPRLGVTPAEARDLAAFIYSRS